MGNKTSNEAEIKNVIALIKNRKYKKVKKLIRKNAFNINGEIKAEKWEYHTVLTWAIDNVSDTQDNLAYTIRRIMKHPDCDVNYETSASFAYSALQRACYVNNVAGVKILLENEKCSINKEQRMRTPLGLALDNGIAAYDVLNVLLKNPRVKINIDRTSRTSLEEFIQNLSEAHGIKCQETEKVQDVINLFKSKGALVQPKENIIIRVLIKIIIFLNLSPDDEYPYSRNFILYALERCSFQTFSALMELPFDVNCHDKHEYPIHVAVRINSFSKCSLLIKKGALLNTEWKGMNALQYGIAIAARKDILLLLAKSYSQQEIATYLNDYSSAAETASECANRLGVPSWKYFFNQTKTENENESMEPAMEVKFENNFYSMSPSLLSKKTSTTLRPISNKTIPSLDGYSALETVLQCNKYLRPPCKESLEVADAVFDLIIAVSDVFQINDKWKHLAFKAKLSGSSAEHTKCYFPDEFDIICELTNLGEIKTEYSYRGDLGSSVIILEDCQKSLFSLSDNAELTQELATEFYSAFEYVIKVFISQKRQFGRLYLMKQPLLWRDKISCLQLQWQGDEFPNMMIYVDLVPSITMTENKPKHKRPFPLGIKCNDFHLITKLSRRNGFSTDFPISYAEIEKAIFAALPDDVKHGYIFAKAIRISSICHPYNLESHGIEEPIKSDDFITSYLLKNTLLYIIYRDESILKQRKTPYEWADVIYEQLQIFLELRAIPLWYAFYSYRVDGRHALFLDCRPSDEESNFHNKGMRGACCVKRELMLEMTMHIRTWLFIHMQKLKESDLFLNDFCSSLKPNRLHSCINCARNGKNWGKLFSTLCSVAILCVFVAFIIQTIRNL